MRAYAISDVSKSFGAVRALEGVTLEPEPGSIHAIVGENGAGKSTLMNVLFGLYQPDRGRITIDGQPQKFRGPDDAQRCGIGMIHQQLSLVETMTVVENVALGSKNCAFRIDWRRSSESVLAIAGQLGFSVDPRARVDSLPLGVRQQVEILKLIERDAEMLIFDEPTSSLAPEEIDRLLRVLRRLKSAGKTILLITHKLREVLSVADRIAVMRRGRLVAQVEAADVDIRRLATLMTGEESAAAPAARPPRSAAPFALEARSLTVGSARRVSVDRVSLALAPGEVFGLAGVSGNGQSELAEAIAGMRPLKSGGIFLDGVEVTRASIRDRTRRHRLGYTPADRHGVALVLHRDLTTNSIARRSSRDFARWGLLSWSRIRAWTRELIQKYRIVVRHEGQAMRHLSGGNQQKFVLGRELGNRPKVLIVDNPTQGLDVRAIESLHAALLEEAAQGVAVLYVSTEWEHLVAICDRVGVMFRGRLHGVLKRDEATAEALGRLMAGLNPADAGAAA